MGAVDKSEDRIVTFLLVDDHAMYRLGLRRLIAMQQGWRVVGEASCADDALRLAAELRPHVAIMDLRLKEGDGLDTVRRMGAADAAIRILVSSVNDEKLYADKCLNAGASGYVEKVAPVETFVAAIEKLLAGGIYLSDTMTERLVARSAGQKPAANPLDQLTPREREVYALLGAGDSVKQIAGKLGISAKTVEYHRQQLKRKLQLATSSALARHAMISRVEADAEA